ncbi:ATP-dependent DNA ligase [Streptomyces capoamus]
MQPDVVMEADVDVARDSAGRWRHPARPHRIRADVDAQEMPQFGEGGVLS